MAKFRRNIVVLSRLGGIGVQLSAISLLMKHLVGVAVGQVSSTN